MGFRAGQHCRTPVAPGEALCGSHLKVETRIAQQAERIHAEAMRHMVNDPFDPVESVAWLKRASKARSLAEDWWITLAVRYIPAGVRRAVLDSGPCAYCGDPWPTAIDHIMPVSRGGLSERENLAPACKHCNDQKLDFTPDEWRDWRLSRGLCWPPKPRVVEVTEMVRSMMPEGTSPEEIADMCTFILTEGRSR